LVGLGLALGISVSVRDLR